MKDKSIKKSYISFLGESSHEVTGSAYLINHKQYQILLDCGLIQGHGDIYSNYCANYDQAHKFRPKLIDAILVSHANIDHHALIPYLYGHGCSSSIFVPEGNAKYIKLLWQDSYNIMLQDCLKIEKKRGRKAPPLYSQEDIERAFSHIVEIPFNYPININEDISFEFLFAGHIQHSSSIYLTLKRGYTKKTIWYSGDIGPDTKQMYVEERQTPKYFDIGIMENTYNQPSRVNKARDREKDLEKIVTIVNEYQRTIIPAFALNRTQVILTELYKLWENNKIPHDIKIILDAPLGIRFSNIWDGDEWGKIWNWDNIIKVSDMAETIKWQKRNDKIIIIAGSGMCSGGKIISWIKSSLPYSNSHLMFIGYCPPEGLASEIKSNKKYVTIEKEGIENNCNYTELYSFSSHASREELIRFYSSLNGLKYCMVHGDSVYKPQFCNDLQEELSSQGKSSRVICTNADSKLYF